MTLIDGDKAYIGLNDPFPVNIKGKCGSITMFGKTIIPLEYDAIIASKIGYDKVNIVQKESAYFLTDSIGNRINNKNYSDVFGYWNEDYILGYKLEVPVFIDVKGNEFDKLPESEQQYQKFQKSDTLLLVNRKGKIINKRNYDFYDLSESKGYFIVKGDGKKGVIDIEGKEILPLKYDNIWHKWGEEEITFELLLNDKKGVCGIKGEVTWE
jgi:hypothetical protein